MRVLFKLATLATVVALAACTAVPIRNVSSAPVTTASGKALTDDQVKGAIIRAGSALGWQMKEMGSGKLGATLNLRKHEAVIEIPYSRTGYSINYKSSTGLDESGGNIHKNYNGWIENLTRGINAQLSAS